jgi:ribonuclease HI
MSNGRRKEIACGFRRSTNNRMELRAAIVALEALRSPSAVTLYSDSLYLVKAMRNRWVTRWQSRNWRLASKGRASNVDLWKRLLELSERHQLDFRWVRGHAEDAENIRCDELAAQARKGALQEDIGYE